MISENSTVQASKGLVSTNLAGEAVVLDTKSAMYFGLNEVGARIFDLIQHERPVSEICDALTGEYDVPRDQCLHDVVHLLTDMESQGLVQIAHGATA